jgi:1-acyl-sn-glycerol-3-phosphate acyltransferase
MIKPLFKIYQWMLWNIATRFLFINVLLRRSYPFSLTEHSDTFPKPPFLVVANHGTFFDPWIIGSHTTTPLGIMTNDDGFRDGIVTRWYLKSIGAFPKKKGAADYRAMKKTLDLLRSGVPVCIFPEGQTTWDGETQLLYPGIEKLIKRTGCKLVTVRLQGNFLMKPWWAKSKRSGRIRITVSVHTPEKIKRLSTEELFSLIRQSIYQNDIKDPENTRLPFSGRNLAEGLERFVWICMQCAAEDTLVMEGNRITCTACGSIWEIDPYCRLTPVTAGIASCTDLKDWADLHKTRVKENIARHLPETTSTSGVTLLQENEQHDFTETDRGDLILEPDLLRFKGTSTELQWPIADLEDYVIQKKDLFEFRQGKHYHRFLFTGKSPMKWVYYLRYLKGFEHCEAQGHL